ncbi:hypothetical protein CCHR01_01721 [Colletotrichum chrysophilum]|uniref:Uncharacterized protein n=1 Tax=Colletotrichum chrysophilum TaxID=1836956 RepID=A0AAD9EQ59_9PEZI|nr:hypothetical protein CCHR01_01721 [Colletotrichum chrysophilum]
MRTNSSIASLLAVTTVTTIQNTVARSLTAAPATDVAKQHKSQPTTVLRDYCRQAWR